MQVSGLLPTLTSGMTPSRPASSVNATMRTLAKSSGPTQIGPQKKRRQLTASTPQLQPPPFAHLQGLLQQALRGHGAY